MLLLVLVDDFQDAGAIIVSGIKQKNWEGVTCEGKCIGRKAWKGEGWKNHQMRKKIES